MSRFFINHPVFAWVIAILITLGGVLAILNLGVESYPEIAPPQVTVNATSINAIMMATSCDLREADFQRCSKVSASRPFAVRIRRRAWSG